MTIKRFIFLILFYLVWPLWGVVLWISFALDYILFPGFEKTPTQKPLFILGNYRSGSTYLQRMIALDPQFTSPTTWDIFISPSITLSKVFSFFRKIDNALGGLVFKTIEKIDALTLGRVDIHKISFFDPEEDENFLLHIWSTSFACTMFPFIKEFTPYLYFDKKIGETHKSKIMRFYRSCMNRHMHANPHSMYYLSKNPSFSPKIGSIYKYFPDARIIYLVRNPLEMLPSTISWWSYLWHTFSDPLEKYPNVEEMMRFTKHWYQYPLEVLESKDPESYLILEYDSLIQDTKAVVKTIYKKFGYQMTQDFLQRLDETVEESSKYRSSHKYSLDEMGLTSSQILDEYKPVFDRFKFKTDPSGVRSRKLPDESLLD
jgi:hypothetical protein